MKRNLKGLLFFSICLIFIIATPIIVFYCQGYRFDFQTKKIVQTGGIFLKVSPPGVKIYINDLLSKKTNFFFDTAFFSGLLPKDYTITVEKDGYHPWNKTLEIKEKKVTETKYISLLPRDPKFNFLFKNINDFFPAPDNKGLILVTSDKNGWLLSYFDQLSKKEIKLTSQKELQELTSQTNQSKTKVLPEIGFLNLEWSLDSKKTILTTITKGEKQYFIIDILPEIKIRALNFENQIKDVKNISFDPRLSEQIFFLGFVTATTTQKNALEQTKTAQEKQNQTRLIFRFKENEGPIALSLPQALAGQNIMDYFIINDNIVFLTDSGFMHQGKIDLNKIELLGILNLKPLTFNPSANYQIVAKNLSKIFVKENEALYLLDSQTHLFQKVFDSIKEIKFSDDSKKIAVNNGHQIWLFYIEEEREQPSRALYEKAFLVGYSDQIENLFWLNDYYLIFKLKDSVNIAEIDNRSKLNLIELTTFPQLRIYWSQKQKTFFVLSENNLYYSDTLLK